MEKVNEVIFCNFDGLGNVYRTREIVAFLTNAIGPLKYHYYVTQTTQRKVIRELADIKAFRTHGTMPADRELHIQTFSPTFKTFVQDDILYINTTFQLDWSLELILDSMKTQMPYVGFYLKDFTLAQASPAPNFAYAETDEETKATFAKIDNMIATYTGKEPVLLANDCLSLFQVLPDTVKLSCTSLKYASKLTSKRNYAFVFAEETPLYAVGTPYDFRSLFYACGVEGLKMTGIEIAYLLKRFAHQVVFGDPRKSYIALIASETNFSKITGNHNGSYKPNLVRLPSETKHAITTTVVTSLVGEREAV